MRPDPDYQGRTLKIPRQRKFATLPAVIRWPPGINYTRNVSSSADAYFFGNMACNIGKFDLKFLVPARK